MSETEKEREQGRGRQREERVWVCVCVCVTVGASESSGEVSLFVGKCLRVGCFRTDPVSINQSHKKTQSHLV